VFAEELVLFVVPFCTFSVLFCPKAEIAGNSNITAIKKNKIDPTDVEDSMLCFG